MDHHHNEAYDFAMFEPKRVDESKQRNNIIELPKEKLEENRRHKLNPFHVVFTFFFMTGMRRASDIGIPYWVYPVFIILILLSRLINEEISEFLFLGMYIFLLQPGRNNN